MPEKPEVITVAKTLERHILGKTIEEVKVYWDNIIASPTSLEFQKKVINQKINDITTRGKFIVIGLDDYSLLVHLRMEGKFMFRKKGEAIGKHEHVEFILDDEVSFRFHDVRKFGKMHLLDKDNYLNELPLKDMGYEFDDKNLTKNYLYNKLQTKTIPIKTSLLDQSIITGIGNIYDDEILFLSKINPKRKSNTITLKECKKIIDNTNIVLNKAIKLGGTTIKSFTSSEGVHGLFQNELLVHGKKNGVCPECGELLKNIKISVSIFIWNRRYIILLCFMLLKENNII